MAVVKTFMGPDIIQEYFVEGGDTGSELVTDVVTAFRQRLQASAVNRGLTTTDTCEWDMTNIEVFATGVDPSGNGSVLMFSGNFIDINHVTPWDPTGGNGTIRMRGTGYIWDVDPGNSMGRLWALRYLILRPNNGISGDEVLLPTNTTATPGLPVFTPSDFDAFSHSTATMGISCQFGYTHNP